MMKMPNRVALKTPFLSTKKADITGPEMNPKTSRVRGNGEMRGNTVSRIGKTVSWTEKAASLTPEMISLTDGTIAAAEAPAEHREEVYAENFLLCLFVGGRSGFCRQPANKNHLS